MKLSARAPGSSRMRPGPGWVLPATSCCPFPTHRVIPNRFFYFYFLIKHHRNLNLRQNGSTKKAAHHCVVSYEILQPPTKPRVFHSVPSFKKCRAHFSTMQQLCCSAQEGTSGPATNSVPFLSTHCHLMLSETQGKQITNCSGASVTEDKATLIRQTKCLIYA